MTRSRRSTENRLAPRKARRRPKGLRIVVCLERGHTRRQRDPRQLGARVDVHVGRERARLVERTDAHETQLGHTAVLAAERYLAGRAAQNAVRSTAVRRY